MLPYTPLRSRLAPTPSGLLHIGNAFSFVLTWLMVRKQSGQLLLRIDDLDAPRTREEYVEEIFRTIEWLGIDYDEGPQNVEEWRNTFSQHQRVAVYEKLKQQLASSEKVFACVCSRKQLHDPDHICDCAQKKIPFSATDAAWRIAMTDAAVSFNDISGEQYEVKLHECMRHFVVWRRDGLPAYQLASLADDLHFDINLIVRGKDLVESTAAQLFLADCMGNEKFSETQFLHHSLVLDEQGEKLSKSAGSTSIKAWRENGRSSEEFYRLFSSWMGWRETALNSRDAIALHCD